MGKKAVRQAAVLQACVVLMLIALTTPLPGYAYELERQTVQGKVMGTTGKNNTLAWLGIPYARPPVGDLRWKAPRDPEPWQGVRDAVEYACECTHFALQGRELPKEPTAIGSEDCLYLNVWRPNNDRNKLPVLVRIHGGANTLSGSYTGVTQLASETGCVEVMMNYRLGFFGWLTHPALRKGDNATDDSGNYGTLDIVKALVWVHDNIAQFGGDPGNVTIEGCSAGGTNVIQMVLSPLAQGLFHKAMAFSNGFIVNSVAAGEEQAKSLLVALLIKDGSATDNASARTILAGMSNSAIEAYLRSKPAPDILAGHTKFIEDYPSFTASARIAPAAEMIFGDGVVMPADGYGAFARGAYTKVPIVMGNCKDEFKIFLRSTLYFAPLFEGALIPDLALRGEDRDLYETAAFYGTSFWRASFVDSIARNMSLYQNNVYVCRFDWEMPWPYNFTFGASHCIDHAFFMRDINGLNFCDKGCLGPLGALVTHVPSGMGLLGYISRQILSDTMWAYYKPFMENGVPDAGSSLPAWKAWSNDEGAPKSIAFAMHGWIPDVKMISEEKSVDGVMEDMIANVPEPTFSFIVKEFFTGYDLWPGNGL
jgi:para-nitrobenzyl esterase